MHQLDIFRRVAAHIAGVAGSWLSLYGLFEIRGVIGLYAALLAVR